MQQSPAWDHFRKSWGEDWGVRWDERTATPRFLYAPGVSSRESDGLVHDIALLAGVDPRELFLTQESTHPSGHTATWRRFHQGAEVLGDQIAVASKGGRIHGIWVQLSPLGNLPLPLDSEKILPIPLHKGPTSASTGLTSHLVTEDLVESIRVYRNRSGKEVYRTDTRHFGTIEMSLEERTVDDPMIVAPARKVTVVSIDGTDIVETNDSGFHDLSLDPLIVQMSGSELIVTNNRAEIHIPGSPDMRIEGGLDVPLSATSVHHHFGVAWDWLKTRRPSHPWLQHTVQATVELREGSCNAYYTSGTINFLEEDPEKCHNLGQIADVTYHEMGHGFHHYILEAGTFAGDISEGSADYVSATILDDSQLAPNARLDGSFIRELDTDKRYPEDAVGEVHTDGLIWGSFLWNLREQWQAEAGEAGIEQTDLLFLNALAYGPTLTDAYEAIILADDDDGNWSNSTPHACELSELLNHHGLGPGPLGVLVFDHTPIESAGSFEENYPVDFSLYRLTEDCLDGEDVEAQIWYTVDSTADLPDLSSLDHDTESQLKTPGEGHPTQAFDTRRQDTASPDTGPTDTGPTDTGAPGPSDGEVEELWTSIPLTEVGPLWSGTFPRQLPGTEVRYFILIQSQSGAGRVTTHGDLESQLYRFRVGDRESLWCEDFSGDDFPETWSHGPGLPEMDSESLPPELMSQWQVGPPIPTIFSPDSPWSGESIAATALNGSYQSSNAQYLRSPVLAFGAVDNPIRLLTYRRWLTVEDGLYDQAIIRVNSTQLWSNLRTEKGDSHHIDLDWTLHELDLLQLEDPTQFQFDWILLSDGGLEYGGWAIDQICVVELDDLEGHYRVRDLVASDDQDTLSIQWTQPWIQPLSATVLVRKADSPPTSPTDGALIQMNLSPQYGAQIRIEDPSAVPGRTYYFAVFASPEPGEWVLQTIQGENLDSGSVPGLPGSDTAESSPTDTGSSGKTIGCGCSNAGSGTIRRVEAGIFMLLGLLYRRRRSSVRKGRSTTQPSL